MKKIVFCDVDGTLLNSEHRITSLTERAIKGLKEKGIPFVIISARSPSGIYPIINEYQLNCSIISYSGALILDGNKNILFHSGIKKIDVKNMIEFVEENQLDMTWCIYSLDEWIVKDKSDPRIIREETIVKAESKQGTVDSITDDEINKILCICNPMKILEIEAKLKAAFPSYSIVKSSDILLEIMENSITKATAIKTLCSLWNIPLLNTIAFGDNYNDIEMLELVGNGFLMGNAPTELKKRFNQQTNDNDHDGIYYALLKMDLIN
ncbi:MAG: Cof-type HAD-IIB family hydrolase [Lachnospiraceae bacterium]|nr:Cof-type HAD-IIB family hydrolase [Lachnospiraceae bacterium]